MSNRVDQQLIDEWLGELQLNFAVRKGRSVLTKCKHVGPFCVQKSFYADNDDTPHVYLLHPPGGLVGGDKLVLDVMLEENSRALLTTLGSTKFYRSNGMYATQICNFRLENNTVLEWVPQSSMFFSKTKAKMSTTFTVGKGARIIAFEMLFFGNLSLDTYDTPEEVDIFLEICDSNSIGLRERLHINKLDCVDKLSGFKISAVFFAIPADEKMLSKVRALIASVEFSQISGVTLLDEILIVRLLSNDNRNLKNLLYNIWYVIRPFIIGRAVVIPRIWLT